MSSLDVMLRPLQLSVGQLLLHDEISPVPIILLS
jgi:hypothetical protein